MYQPINTTLTKKIVIVTFFGLFSIIGLMTKLPPIFRTIDKEMHFLFYFFGAAFLNLLFGNGKFFPHLIIFAFLLCFGFVIEHAQEYSNKFFSKRIHGNYDSEDIKYNLMGLVLFSSLWVFSVVFHHTFNKNLKN